MASLEALIAAQHQLVAVVTAPDKPAGSGMQLQASPVKTCALKYLLPIWQPEKLKDPQFVEQLRAAHADVFVVVAFRMLPEVIWSMPPQGTINVYGSLLPQYRGAAPIHWAVMNGETETGVTTFQLQHHRYRQYFIAVTACNWANRNHRGLYERMMHAGGDLLVKTLANLEAGQLVPRSQWVDGEIKHAPKLNKHHGLIDWHQSRTHILNQIRGLLPLPSAYTFMLVKQLKIHRAHAVDATPLFKPGTVFTDAKTFGHIACVDGWIALDDIQLEGKKRMNMADFLRGNTLPACLGEAG